MSLAIWKSPVLCLEINKWHCIICTCEINNIFTLFRNVWLLCRFIWRRIPWPRNRFRILHESRIDGQCNGNGRNVLLRPVLQCVRKRGRYGSVNSRFPGFAICSRTSHAESELPVRGIRTIAIFKFSVLLVPFLSFRFLWWIFLLLLTKQEVVDLKTFFYDGSERHFCGYVRPSP